MIRNSNLFVVLLSFALISYSCTNKKREAELQNRISELELQLEECMNGASKLLGKMNVAFEKKQYDTVKSIYVQLEEKYPETDEYEQAKTIYANVKEIEKQAAEEAARIKKELAEKAEKERKEKLKVLNKLRKKKDDISHITWYHQPYFTHYTNSNLVSIYIGHNAVNTWIRLLMTYEGEDWIFFERAYLSYDGHTKEVIFDKYKEKKTDNDGGYVWEWIDVNAPTDMIAFLRSFAKSSNAKMRLSGKYSKTRTLTYNERKGILDVLDGYDALKETSTYSIEE